MKQSRLFEILYVLMQNKGATAGELAERLEVSERTIYRDIDELSAAGIPVYAQRGQGGGIRILDRFVLDRALLSKAQQDEILFALQAVLSTGAGEDDATLSRVRALFQRDMPQWLEVDFASWGSGSRARENFALLKQALLARKAVTFTYYGTSGEAMRRTVEPARLILKGCWYLSAFCRVRQDWRTFRLHRMADIEVESEVCPVREAPGPIASVAPEECRTVHLRLRIAPRAAWHALDFFDVREITWQKDGSLLVETSFPETPWILSFLLSFGSDLEVISPGEWRRALAREAKKTLAAYETRQTLSGSPSYAESGRAREGAAEQHAKEMENDCMENQAHTGCDFPENITVCQSCAMPLMTDADRGTNADGSLSEDYCRYCYQHGEFTKPDETMEGMLAMDLKINAELPDHPMGTQEQAKKMLEEVLPQLKRWKKA